MGLTFGLELEWADVDRHAELPCGQWSTTDYTIVNSDGHANDPTGKRWRWGGEINTEPTDTMEGQLIQVQTLRDLLHPTINYRCNLHVHIGFGEVTLELAKSLLDYIVGWQDSLYPLIEPIPAPRRADYPSNAAFEGARKRYARRKVSHQHRLPIVRVTEALRSDSLDAFYEAHAPMQSNGLRGWHIAPRPGMNTRSLHKHGTLELRHFPGTADPAEVGEALRWAQTFGRCFLADTSPVAAFRAGQPWSLPQFRQYDHALEEGYRATVMKR